MDLALAGRIDSDPKWRFVVNPEPMDEPALAGALKQIAADGELRAIFCGIWARCNGTTFCLTVWQLRDRAETFALLAVSAMVQHPRRGLPSRSGMLERAPPQSPSECGALSCARLQARPAKTSSHPTHRNRSAAPLPWMGRRTLVIFLETQQLGQRRSLPSLI